MKESTNNLKNDILAQLSNATDIEAAVNKAIEMTGKYFHVDRVYIFENSDDDLYCSNTFEWCNEGVTPEKDNLQNLSYQEDLGGTWIDNYNEEGLFFCPTVSELPEKQREVLEPQGIFSMLQCAIKERGEFKGYIGFDNCQDHLGGWEFDQDAIDALVFCSRLLSLFLLEHRNKARQLEYMKQLQEQRQALTDALETAKDASVAKGFFLSNMSHEIRTPLNAIIGYLSIARDEGASEQKIQHCLENCEIASKHLLQIINDVLDMSAIENGKLKIAHEDFDLKREIMDITTIFYQNSRAKGVEFETHIDDITAEWVKGDQLRLNQILMNLLSNAVKFTSEGGKITLDIRQLNEEENRIYVQFTVSDTGIGMSEEYMTRLFNPFEQETASTARKYGGSGLGLSITRNLVNMMNGSIEAKSRQNVGSTFTVTLYFDKSDKQEVPQVSVKDYSHVHILVVDDQPNEGSYVKRMLKRCGVKCDTVSSGAEALHRLEGRMGSDFAYDMCILDWNMPEMNGMEVAKKIRELFGKELPVIIATAYDVTELEDEAKEVGVNRVVAKPLFQSTLFDLLVSSFGKYEPKEEHKKENAQMDLTGVRIILAEDNEMNMEIAVTVLEKAGIQVDQAVNGEEAYELFVHAPEHTYDLILMDVQMPVMDGYEATKKIRSSGHPGAATIPIIAMTANAFAEDVAEALSKGMNAHIAKPVNNDKLFKILKQFSRVQ